MSVDHRLMVCAHQSVHQLIVDNFEWRSMLVGNPEFHAGLPAIHTAVAVLMGTLERRGAPDPRLVEAFAREMLTELAWQAQRAERLRGLAWEMLG